MADGLTATAGAGAARVLLRLEWAAVTSATVLRVHPDGSTYPVRNAEPAPVGTTWVGYDHEVPLDRAVTYRATSTQSGTVHTSGSVTVASLGKTWLTHPAKPWLGRPVTVREISNRGMPDRAGAVYPLDRTDAIVIHATRAGDTFLLAVNTTTSAELEALKAMLADGVPLLLRTPSTWEAAGEALWLRVGPVDRQTLTRVGTDLRRRLLLPVEAAARPAGAAGGPGGLRWDDAGATTWATATGTWDDKASTL